MSADGLTWTYKLKQGITYDDGTPVTSKDVKYAIARSNYTDELVNGPKYFQQYLDAGDYAGPYKDKNLDDFTGIETPDDSTIVFKLKAAVLGVRLPGQQPAVGPGAAGQGQGPAVPGGRRLDRPLQDGEPRGRQVARPGQERQVGPGHRREPQAARRPHRGAVQGRRQRHRPAAAERPGRRRPRRHRRAGAGPRDAAAGRAAEGERRQPADRLPALRDALDAGRARSTTPTAARPSSTPPTTRPSRPPAAVRPVATSRRPRCRRPRSATRRPTSTASSRTRTATPTRPRRPSRPAASRTASRRRSPSAATARRRSRRRRRCSSRSTRSASRPRSRSTPRVTGAPSSPATRSSCTRTGSGS